jgi:hypothetical protein
MPTRKRWGDEKVTTEDREQMLQNEWYNGLPCSDCEVRDICKHAKTFHRPDFNPKVFTVTVGCTIKPQVYARFNTTPEKFEKKDEENETQACFQI